MGFNMSWIFVDQIDLNELYAALDVKSTGEAADPYRLGTSRVPLAGLKPNDGWCAIFGKYSFVLDITIGTDPPRLMRLPAKSPAVSCVVLEHANISYASLWHDGRHIWEVRHQPSREQPEHLDFSGDLPPAFMGIWGAELQKQRESYARRNIFGGWGVDYVFDVPLAAAAEITGFRHDRGPPGPRKEDAYRDVTTLEPINGNSLQRLSKPPKWWQTVRSIKYYDEGEERREPNMEELKQFKKEFMEAVKRAQIMREKP
jgi:hypothetical protein